MPNGAGQQSAPTRSAQPESAADAAARRRAAIQASFHKDTAQSAHIPSGGIDGVASRATANLRAHGVDLDIANAASDTSGGHGGFASARGMKREG